MVGVCFISGEARLQEVKNLALAPQLDLEVLDIKLRSHDYKISTLSNT